MYSYSDGRTAHSVVPFTGVGYQYQAEELCPRCLLWQVGGTKAGVEFHGDADLFLNTVAQAQGIDRDTETSFDSDEFPKVLPSGHEYDCTRCGDSY
jgi:hypothetical protein